MRTATPTNMLAGRRTRQNRTVINGLNRVTDWYHIHWDEQLVRPVRAQRRSHVLYDSFSFDHTVGTVKRVVVCIMSWKLNERNMKPDW